jgi:hypothetical protein
MEKWIELAREAHQTALEKGWWDECKSEGMLDGALDIEKVYALVPEKIALLHSEVSEALEEWRDGRMAFEMEYWPCEKVGKPVGFPSELADVVIRAWDLQGALGRTTPPVWNTFSLIDKNATTPRNLAYLHKMVTACLEISHSDRLTTWATDCLHFVVRWTFEIAKIEGVDLGAAIAAKMAYNKTRAHRHGGKRA